MRLLLAALLAASPAFAARHHKTPPRRKATNAQKTPQPRRPAKSAASPAKPAAILTPVEPQRDDAALSAFGAVLVEDADGLVAAGSFEGSPAHALGLQTGDRILRAARASVRTRAEAAAALMVLAPELRQSLAIRRGLKAVALVGPETPAPANAARRPLELSSREWALAQARASKGALLARDAASEATPLDWTLRADQALWVRFPGGLPAELKRGDIVLAESASPLTTDDSLDFLAVPSKSRIWARVLKSSDDGSVQTVRLAFQKLQLAGGGVYPILGAATALAGISAPDLAHISAGGTLAVASPLPDAAVSKRRGVEPLLDSDARMRVRLIEPAVITEAPSWWRAGPGLWVKTVERDGRRLFEVTRVVAGRSAETEGLRPGELLDSIASRSSDKMDFADALDALYGPPDSFVKVSVLRGGRAVELALRRGVKIEKGTFAPLALPFEAR